MIRSPVFISERFRFVYVGAPKVASTAMMAEMAAWHELDGLSKASLRSLLRRRGSRRLLRRAGLRRTSATAESLPQVVQPYGDYFFFTFVRDPYRRLQSAYANKLNRFARAYHPAAYAIAKAYQCATFGIGRSGQDRFLRALTRAIPFEELVAGLEEHGAGFDAHFVEQHRLVHPNAVAYDAVGRLESFEEDLREIKRRLGLGDRPAESGACRNSSSAVSGDRSLFTPDLRRRVHALYRVDFEKFGYAA